MASTASLSLQFPPFPSLPTRSNPHSLNPSRAFLPSPRLLHLSLKTRTRIQSIEKNQEEKLNTDIEIEAAEDVAVKPQESPSVPDSDIGSEIKEAMRMRKEEEGKDNLWSGVAEEIREIEWPPFGKVLGTTGVVLGVIAGSSVVLLTVNAILAELSDGLFAGRGVQDFFG